MVDDIINKFDPQTEKSISQLKDEFRTLHTGKASATLIEDVLVDYYGTKTPLKQMAQISTPQNNQILITPWDKSTLKDIENAIRNSDLGINPIGESGQIRLVLPPLSEERRRELSKVIHQKAEAAKVIVRNLRRDIWAEVQQAEKNGSITEDDKYKAQEELNKKIDTANAEIDKLAQEKEAEIMKV